jgi:hypothetical protein
MIENCFVAGSEQFVDMTWWDQAAVAQRTLSERNLSVVLGADAG